MKHKVKKISLIAGTESTKLALLTQLELLLGQYVEIESYAIDTGIEGVIKSDLVIISTKLILYECVDYIHKDCPIVIARRSLNISNIDKVFSIPDDSTILLVNDAIETSLETIELLKGLGINHLNYIPYYPGHKTDTSFDIAITPGESRLVPSFVKEIIDLGPRLIDLTTIVEILEKLNLLDENAHFVSAKYLERIISLSKQLYSSIEEGKSLNQYLLRVLNQVNDGIIVFDRENIVTVFNEKAEALLKTHYSKALGKNIMQVIRDRSLIDYLIDEAILGEQIFKLYDIDIIVNKFHVDKLSSTVCTIKNAEQTLNMDIKLRRLLFKKGHISKYTFDDIIGNSSTINSTIEIAKKLSKTDLTILINGESGTGKELFAGSIHNYSDRSNGPYLAVNFSSISEDLVESELFGYEEGAFTGARKGGRIGLFEQANNGTIFLDEIGDTSLKIQARLLRVIQEKEIIRVGGTEIIPVNVRIITATNKDLSKMCSEGLFRQDLYYRLKNLYIKTPSLRDRKEDIPLLINHFLSKDTGLSLDFSQEVTDIIYSYDWPGNVRELENLIEYMVAVNDSKTITEKDLPEDFFDNENNFGIKSRSKEIYDHLRTKNNPGDFHFIMNMILERNKSGKSVGRKWISLQSKNHYYFMTEEQIRSRCNVLEELGLVSKTRGPMGMRLTDEGIEYIKMI